MRRAALLLAAFLLAASSCASRTNTGSREPPEAIYVDPARAGWNVDALEELAAWAGANGANALIVIEDERIVLERFWPADTQPDMARKLSRQGQDALEGFTDKDAPFQRAAIAGTPHDLEVMRGKDGAVVYLSPKLALVVVSIGAGDAGRGAALWSRLMKAVPPAKQ